MENNTPSIEEIRINIWKFITHVSVMALFNKLKDNSDVASHEDSTEVAFTSWREAKKVLEVIEPDYEYIKREREDLFTLLQYSLAAMIQASNDLHAEEECYKTHKPNIKV